MATPAHDGLSLVIYDRIREREVRFFNNFTIGRKYDAMSSTFSFGFYFDPENKDLKELACIGHYHICKVYYNRELILTGVVLSESFVDAPERQLMQIGGYSLPGVLEDCDIPTDMYPLQAEGLSLRAITEKLIKPFGLKLVVDAIAKNDSLSPVTIKKDNNGVDDEDTNTAYAQGNSESSADAADKDIDKTTAPTSTNIKSYLCELAVQKNIVFSHNEHGDLVITEADTESAPILDFDTTDGAIPGTEFSCTFNGQGMHSHITVIKQASQDADSEEPANAAEYTIRNPYVISTVYRPRVAVMSAGDDMDIVQYAKRLLAEELKNLSWTITTDRWIIDGKMIKPNTTIAVLNPNIYLYKKTKLFVESIDFSGDNTKNTAVLHCVLPEVYSRKQPFYLYAGINTH